MKAFITIVGLNSYKEPENRYDKEAIRAELPGLGLVGYVANSTYTVKGECISAGRLYDKIGGRASARVCYILANALVCRVKTHTESFEESAALAQ